jgi:hypothetical protein
MSKSTLAALAVAFCCVAGVAAEPAGADGVSTPAAQAHLTIEEAAAFSKQIERTLAADGVRVAMVFRTGFPRDELPEGIDYTHGAFWVYRDIVSEDGETRQGYAVYNLYNGDGDTFPSSRSYLKQDWPLDFVRGTAVDDVGVIVPTPEMQRRILEIIDSPLYEALHNPSYSLVANPHEQTYQNCNSFMLTIVSSAAWETEDRAQIASNLRAHFEPQTIEVGRLKRFFGPMVDDRLHTDDHDGAIRTATFASMAAFLEKFSLSRSAYVIQREGV